MEIKIKIIDELMTENEYLQFVEENKDKQH